MCLPTNSLALPFLGCMIWVTEPSHIRTFVFFCENNVGIEYPLTLKKKRVTLT